jgi:Cytochrome C biogenesis protein transmembrane region
MLGSINPLGERARGSSWAVTVATYSIGSVAAASAVGVTLGGIGALTLSWLPASVRLALLGVIVLAGLGLDLRAARPAGRVPGPRRQVDEDWLSRYRGWVYGVAFGFQLGLGVTTIVTTSAVYATLAAAALTGSARGGLVVGATFGMARALPLVAGGRIRHGGQLLTLDATLRRWDRPAWVTTMGLQAGVAIAMVAAARA